MQNKVIKFRVLIVAAGLLLANPVSAFDMGDMMNPSKWTGGNKDRDRYDDYGPGYGYGGPGYGYGGPGYGYGGPGYGYGGGPGYGGYPGYGGDPGYGYGGAPGYGGESGYGYGGAPGYGYGSDPGYGGAYGAPGTGSNEAEIKRLKARLRQLESGPK